MSRLLAAFTHAAPFALVPLGMILFIAALAADIPGYLGMRFVCAAPVWTEREHRPPGWECPVRMCP